MKRVERKIVVDDAKEYNCAGVKWHGKGVFLRETKKGFNIKKKDQWVIHEGDVIYNKLFAWKGSFAIVDKENHGIIASDKFPTYTLNTTKVYPNYLKLFFRSDNIKNQSANFSKGGASISKFTLNPPDFMKLKIVLPDIETQKKISDNINLLFNNIAHLLEKNSENINYIKNLYPSIFNNIITKCKNTVKLSDFLEQVKDLVKIDDTDVYKQVTVKMNSEGVVLRKEVNGLSIKQKTQNKVKEGQLIFSRIDARNGAIGIIPGELDGGVVSNDFPTFNVDYSKILPNFLKILLSTYEFIDKCAEKSVGTTNRKRLKVEHFLEISINLPPINEQEEIIKKMKRIKERNTEVTKLLISNLNDCEEFKGSILKRTFGI